MAPSDRQATSVQVMSPAQDTFRRPTGDSGVLGIGDNTIHPEAGHSDCVAADVWIGNGAARRCNAKYVSSETI